MPITKEHYSTWGDPTFLFDSVIRFGMPIRATYKTLNQHFFEGEPNVEIKGSGEISRFGAEWLYITVNATGLVVSTADWTKHTRERDPFVTDVGRVTDSNLPSSLSVKPDWPIEDYPNLKMGRRSGDLEAAITTHNKLVRDIMSSFGYHQPCVLYEGSFLLIERTH